MAMANKKGSLSNTVGVKYGSGNNRTPKDDLLHVNKSAQQVEKDRRKRRDYVSGKLYLIPCVLRSPNRSHRDEFRKSGYHLRA